MVTKDRRFQNHRAFVLNQTGVRSRFGIIMQIGFMRCTMDAEVLILHKPSHDKLNSPVMLCDTELDSIPRVTSERHLLEVIFKIAVAQSICGLNDYIFKTLQELLVAAFLVSFVCECNSTALAFRKHCGLKEFGLAKGKIRYFWYTSERK